MQQFFNKQFPYVASRYFKRFFISLLTTQVIIMARMELQPEFIYSREDDQ